jgi:outer membrane receptor protein involved in Fe transport
VVFRADGSAALVRRTEAEAVQEGVIVGRVTDRQTAGPIVGAAIEVQGTRLSATSGDDGRYRIAGVPVGSYAVRARYIGYAPATVSVTVRADEEATADFALEKSAQRLDEVVTTGTIVPTAVKALPTPITVITGRELEEQNVRTLQQLFRQAVPSAVGWDIGGFPMQTAISTRGASTLTSGVGGMKVYVDGIELSNQTFAAVDPMSIARVEVIRGPQAATIYGSDAIGGVLQIFTKRGDSTLARPRIEAQVGLGVVESPYPESGVLRQVYSGSVQGGTPTASYNFGGGYSRTGNWVPEVATSIPSAYGGVHLTQGPLSVDLSGRFYVFNAGNAVNPAVFNAGVPSYSKPFADSEKFQLATYGAHFIYLATPSWRHSLTVGVDQLGEGIAQREPRLTTPGDTLLKVFAKNQRKVMIAYNSTVEFGHSRGVSGTFTAGFDHSDLRDENFFHPGALNTTGTIISPAGVAPSLARSITTNTGVFGQVQLALRDALFVTGGLRAEENSNFGNGLATPVSPRVGLSYVRRMGSAEVKLRGSYGEAILAPGASQKDAALYQIGGQIANPNLGPARQKGWDAGVDLVFGARASFSATYYDQRARDLIQQILLDPEKSVYQFQNVARIRNSGVELEGQLDLPFGLLRAQYAYTRAEIRDVGPNYGGDLRTGDQALLIPKHAAGGSVTLSPLRFTSITAGVVYVGSRTTYDALSQLRCFGGTGPCRSTSRDYLVEYPGFVKINLNASRRLGRALELFVSIENLNNSHAAEFSNSIPILGRTTMFGFRAQH